MIEPISLSFEVDCPADHAFRVWTALTSSWWPADHTNSGESGLAVVFEPHVGGRIFERTLAGDETDWGEIIVWEPPRRLTYLWHLRADRVDATEVQITFAPTTEGRTRVDIEHRGWERLGEAGPARREGNLGGWRTLLPHFEAAVARQDA